MKLSLQDVLHSISFLLTIMIILIGIRDGLNSIELILNVVYFMTLNLTFIIYIMDKIK